MIAVRLRVIIATTRMAVLLKGRMPHLFSRHTCTTVRNTEKAII